MARLGVSGPRSCNRSSKEHGFAILVVGEMNAGAGTVNFVRQTGGSLGTTLGSFLSTNVTFYHSEGLAMTQDASNASSRELLDGVVRLLNEAGVAEAVQQPGALHYLGEVAHAQGITRAFQDGFRFWPSFVCRSILAWILSQTRRR